MEPNLSKASVCADLPPSSQSECQRLVVHSPSVTSRNYRDTGLPSCDMLNNARPRLPFQCHARPLDGPFVECFRIVALHVISASIHLYGHPPPHPLNWLLEIARLFCRDMYCSGISKSKKSLKLCGNVYTNLQLSDLLRDYRIIFWKLF